MASRYLVSVERRWKSDDGSTRFLGHKEALLHPTERLCTTEFRHVHSLKDDPLSQAPFSLFLQPIPSLKTPAGFRLRALTLLGRHHLSLPTHNLELQLSNEWIVRSQGHRKMSEEGEAPPPIYGKSSASSALSLSSLDATTPEELKASPRIATPVMSIVLEPPELQAAKASRLPVLRVSSSKDKKVVGGYRLQTAKYQMEKLQKQQLRVHPSAGDFVPRPPALPRKVPSSHPPAVHRSRLTVCPSSNQRTEQLSHRAEQENLEKLTSLVNPAPSLARCSEMLGPWDCGDWTAGIHGHQIRPEEVEKVHPMSPQQLENRTSSLPVTCASFTKDKKSHNKAQVEKLQRTQLSVCEDSAAPPPGTSAFPRRGCTKLPPIPAPVRKLVLRRNGLSCCPMSRQKEKEAAFNNPRADRGRPVKLPPLSSAEKGLKNCLKIVSSWDWSEWSVKGHRHQKTPEEEEGPSSVSPQCGRRTSRLPVMCTSSGKDKKGVSSCKLQAANQQMEKLQSSLHPNSEDFPAGPPQPAPPPKKNPPPKAVVRRGRLSRSTKHKAEATHDFQRTDSVNLERLLPLPIPEVALDRCFQMLSSEDWQKKVEGLKWIQALAQHNPSTLMVKLPKVCLAVIDEIKNLRSLVDSVAMDTMVYLYVYLQRNMDAYAESTGRALLLKIAQASSNLFTQQRANTALGSMVQNCSPGRVLNALLNTGLSHLSVPVRTSTAQNLHFLSDIMGTDSILKAGQPFNQRFLSAVSKMCVDPSAGVRVHGHTLLQKLSVRPDFLKLWTHMVPERDRRPIDKFLKKEKRLCPR